jgi:hypothetical protein
LLVRNVGTAQTLGSAPSHLQNGRIKLLNVEEWGMLEILWTLLLAIVPTVLSIWLVPIWRSARRTDPSVEFPLEYQQKTLSGAAFRAFQYLIWSQSLPAIYLADQAEFLKGRAMLLTSDRHVAVERLSLIAFVPFPRTSATFARFFHPLGMAWFLFWIYFVNLALLAGHFNSDVIIVVGLLVVFVVAFFLGGMIFYTNLSNFARHCCRLFLYLHKGKVAANWAPTDQIDGADASDILTYDSMLPTSIGMLGIFKRYTIVSAHYIHNNVPVTVPVLEAFGFFFAIAYQYDGTQGIEPAFNRFLEKVKAEAAPSA